MLNRQEIKSKVPKGYNTLIAQRAGVHPNAVSQYLNGKNNSMKIEIATLEILAELSDKKKELLQRIA